MNLFLMFCITAFSFRNKKEQYTILLLELYGFVLALLMRLRKQGMR